MNGVAVLRNLLANNADLTALVPASRIQAGVLPQGTPLPSISITQVSGRDMNIPSPGPTRHVIDRVQVTVLAASYPAQKQIQAAVKDAAADKFPDASGISRVVVHTDGRGPDFMSEDANIYLGTADFRISYSEPT